MVACLCGCSILELSLCIKNKKQSLIVKDDSSSHRHWRLSPVVVREGRVLVTSSLMTQSSPCSWRTSPRHIVTDDSVQSLFVKDESSSHRHLRLSPVLVREGRVLVTSSLTTQSSRCSWRTSPRHIVTYDSVQSLFVKDESLSSSLTTQSSPCSWRTSPCHCHLRLSLVLVREGRVLVIVTDDSVQSLFVKDESLSSSLTTQSSPCS